MNGLPRPVFGDKTVLHGAIEQINNPINEDDVIDSEEAPPNHQPSPMSEEEDESAYGLSMPRNLTRSDAP